MVSACIVQQSQEHKYKEMDNHTSIVTLYRRQRICLIGMFVIILFMISAILVQYVTVTRQFNNMREDIADNLNTAEKLLELNRLQESLPENHADRNNSTKVPLHNRVRRQSSNEDNFIGAHLIGMTGNKLEPRYQFQQIPESCHYFQWNSDDQQEHSMRNISVDVIEEERGAFLVIRRDGYYYVYSQVTYYSTGRNKTGHETVRLFENMEKPLMASIAKQVKGDASQEQGKFMRNLDSAFHSGVFLLSEGDRLGVRSLGPYQLNQHFNMHATKSFFGAILLHAEPSETEMND